MTGKDVGKENRKEKHGREDKTRDKEGTVGPTGEGKRKTGSRKDHTRTRIRIYCQSASEETNNVGEYRTSCIQPGETEMGVQNRRLRDADQHKQRNNTP